jgi:hypothetical protein
MLTVQQLRKIIAETKAVIKRFIEMGFDMRDDACLLAIRRLEIVLAHYDNAPVKFSDGIWRVLTPHGNARRLLNIIIYSLGEELRLLPAAISTPIDQAISVYFPGFVFKANAVVSKLSLSNQWMLWQQIEGVVQKYSSQVDYEGVKESDEICYQGLKTSRPLKSIEMDCVLWLYDYVNSNRQLPDQEKRLALDMMTALTVEGTPQPYVAWYQRAMEISSEAYVFGYKGRRYEKQAPASNLGDMVDLLCTLKDPGYDNYPNYRRHGAGHAFARVLNGASWKPFEALTGVGLPDCFIASRSASAVKRLSMPTVVYACQPTAQCRLSGKSHMLVKEDKTMAIATVAVEPAEVGRKHALTG